jgi:hypothetical protein
LQRENVQNKKAGGSMSEKHAKAARRPRKKGKKGRVLSVLLALVILLLCVAAAVVVAVRQDIGGAGTNGETVTVEIEQGSGVAAIANRLEEAGMIRFLGEPFDVETSYMRLMTEH